MKLEDIHLDFGTDKGTSHNYISFYDTLFKEVRLKKQNILELGVLHGASLKMWHKFFENSNIYGVEDFSQPDGYDHGHSVEVNQQEVEKDLEKYERITLLVHSSEDKEKAEESLGSLKFDIIIDDASHSFSNQRQNMEVYFPYLNDGGLYIIEDCLYEEHVRACLKEKAGKEVITMRGNTLSRQDDVIVYVRK